MTRWLLLLILSVLLSGCQDALYSYGEWMYGVNCRPEVVQATGGKCTYVKKGETHAETPRP